MPKLYDLTNHPSLSDQALQLQTEDGDKFDQLQILVEHDLGLADVVVMTGAFEELATLYLARQITFMLKTGLDPLFIKQISSTHTAQGITFRDGVGVDPFVARGIAKLLDEVTGGRNFEADSILRTLR